MTTRKLWLGLIAGMSIAALGPASTSACSVRIDLGNSYFESFKVSSGEGVPGFQAKTRLWASSTSADLYAQYTNWWEGCARAGELQIDFVNGSRISRREKNDRIDHIVGLVEACQSQATDAYDAYKGSVCN